MRLRFPLSTLCLLVAVIAVFLALFLITAQHNAQLMAQAKSFNAYNSERTARHNAQLLAQAAEHNQQLVAATAECNARLTKQAAEFQQERARMRDKASGTASAR